MTNPELISIVDCELCTALLTTQHAWNPPLPEAWARLATLRVFKESGFAEGDREEMRACGSCGTCYTYSQIYDSHSSEPMPPSTDYHLSRITPDHARRLLAGNEAKDPAAAAQRELLEGRYAATIDLIRRDLPRSPNLDIKKYMVDALFADHVLDRDWDGLKATLLDHSDPAVRVDASERLFDNSTRDWPPGNMFIAAARALLTGKADRERFLVAVLADGLSQRGDILKYSIGIGYRPADVSATAMHALRYTIPRKSLTPAVPALIAQLRLSSCAAWWREAARDLLVDYIGKNRKRAKAISAAIDGDTDEARAVLLHCRQLAQPPRLPAP